MSGLANAVDVVSVLAATIPAKQPMPGLSTLEQWIISILSLAIAGSTLLVQVTTARRQRRQDPPSVAQPPMREPIDSSHDYKRLSLQLPIEGAEPHVPISPTMPSARGALQTFSILFLLSAFNLLALWSPLNESVPSVFSVRHHFFYGQLATTLIGLALYGFLVRISLKSIRRCTVPVVLMALGLTLIAIVQSGTTVNGIAIHVGTLSFDPLLAYPFVVVMWSSRSRPRGSASRRLLDSPYVTVVVWAFLELVQVKYGSIIYALVFLPATYLGIYMGEQTTPTNYRISRRLSVLISAAYALFLVWVVHSTPYLWARIISWLSPQAHSLGDGYSYVQSGNALGHLRPFGNGLSTSAPLVPNPEQGNILVTIGWRLGLIALVVSLGCLVILLTRCFATCRARPQPSGGRRVAFGASAVVCAVAVLGIGGTFGILPKSQIAPPVLGTGTSTIYLMGLLGLVERARLESSLSPPLIEAPGQDRPPILT